MGLFPYPSFCSSYLLIKIFLIHSPYFPFEEETYILINTFPNAITRTAAAIASGIPDATTVPIIKPNTAVTATSFAAAY